MQGNHRLEVLATALLAVAGAAFCLGIAVTVVSRQNSENETTLSLTASSSKLYVSAWYSTRAYENYPYFEGSYVSILVSVSGPQSASGTTTTSGPRMHTSFESYDILAFTLMPGTYTVSGTYGGEFRSENVTLEEGENVWVLLTFGEGPPPWAVITPVTPRDRC